MRIKALLALLGLGLALFFVAGCDDDDVATGTVTGTITNASTGQGQGDATVTLLNNGVVIRTTQTSNAQATLGQYTFTGVPVGTGYTILVTSNEVPAAFQDTTSNVFTVVEGTNVVNLTVGTGVIGTVSGTVTNAATGQGQGNAEVELIQGGNVIATTQTSNAVATRGQFSFTGVTPGAGYTLRVTSLEVPPAFSEVTTGAFTVNAGDNTQNVTVGTGAGTTTVSGTIDSIDTTSSYTVSVMQGATTIASATVPQGPTPGSSPFSLSGITPGSGYTIKAVNNTTGVTTVFGPLTVPAGGVTGVTVFPKTTAQLATDYGVPANANLVAFIPGGGTITANGVTSTGGNPTWLTNVPAGNVTVTVTPFTGSAVQLVVPVSASNVTIIRFNPTP